jgi:hypothetical protein
VSSLSLLEVIACGNVLAEFSCFPHVVNLACKAILSAISKLNYTSVNFDSTDDTFMDAIKQDLIAAMQVLIKAASVISLVFLFNADVVYLIDSCIITLLTILC